MILISSSKINKEIIDITKYNFNYNSKHKDDKFEKFKDKCTTKIKEQLKTLLLNQEEKGIVEKKARELLQKSKKIFETHNTINTFTTSLIFSILTIELEKTNKEIREIFQNKKIPDRIEKRKIELYLFSIDKDFYISKLNSHIPSILTMLQQKYPQVPILQDMKKYTVETTNIFNFLSTHSIQYLKTRTNYRFNTNKKLVRILQEKGLDIESIANNSLYSQVFPKYISAIIIYYLVKKSFIDHGIQLTVRKYSSLIKIQAFKTTVVHQYLKNPLEEITCNKRIVIYDEHNFIEELFKIYINRKSNTAKNLILLFRILKLPLNSFYKIITTSSYTYISQIVQSLKISEFSDKRYRNVYKNIKSIRNTLTERQQQKAKKIIEKGLQQTNKIDEKKLKHNRRISYEFRRNKANIKAVKNTWNRFILNKLLGNVTYNIYPIYLFMRNDLESASNFQILGTREEKIKTRDIEKYLEDLTKQGKITKSDNLGTQLSILARKYGTISGHEIIFSRIIHENMILASEIPIWYRSKITGHIDLLAYDKNDEKIVIGEYKPVKSQMIRGILQTILYGLTLSRLTNISSEKIKCIIFTKNEHLCFSLGIYDNIRQYITTLNAKRTNRIQTKNKKDLLNTLNILNF